jgi:putative membrane protein
MAGGLLKINGLRLYDFIFFNLLGDPFFILKYDQVLHTFCYFVISILIYFILKNYVKKNEAALITFTVLSALGVGLLNEVLEFGMVVFLDAADAVGGYYNTALDLLFNLIGAIIGPFVARKFK